MTKKQRQLMDELERRGFDKSRPTGRKGAHVGCSQCEAAAICGVACHETGCPNTPHDCPECGQTYRTRQEAAECCAFHEFDETDLALGEEE